MHFSIGRWLQILPDGVLTQIGIRFQLTFFGFLLALKKV